MNEYMPNREDAEIEFEKISKYLLNMEHNKGKSKAKYFLSIGFNVEGIQIFIEALKLHAKERTIKKITQCEHGIKYELECELNAPNGGQHCVISIWIIENGYEVPRLVTSYPK